MLALCGRHYSAARGKGLLCTLHKVKSPKSHSWKEDFSGLKDIYESDRDVRYPNITDDEFTFVWKTSYILYVCSLIVFFSQFKSKRNFI